MRLSCAHCGSKIKPDADKCPNCGSTQLEAPTSAPPPRRSMAAGFGLGFTLLGLAVLALSCGGALAWRLLARPAAPARAETTAVEGARGLDAVRARGSLRVAVDPEAPPFLSKSAEGWEGFEYAVVSAIAERAKVPLELVPVGYDDVLGHVASGAVDLGVAQLPPRPYGGVEFSRSYLQYTLCLIVRDEPGAPTLATLRGRRVGLYRDLTAIAVAVDAGAVTRAYDDSGYFADLAAGEIDAVVYDCPLARHELKADPNGPRLRIADDRVSIGTYSIAVTEAIPGLRADVDAVLGELGTSGLIQPLVERWLGAGPQGDATRVVTVRAGEDLAGVAARIGATPDALAARNQDILGTGSTAVYAGMLLRTP